MKGPETMRAIKRPQTFKTNCTGNDRPKIALKVLQVVKVAVSCGSKSDTGSGVVLEQK